MGLGDGAADEEAEAGALEAAREAVLHLAEGLEQSFEVGLADADPGIAHAEHQASPSRMPASIMTCPPASVNLMALERRWSSAWPRRRASPRTAAGRAAGWSREATPACLRRPRVVEAPPPDGADRSARPRDRGAPALDARHVEHGVDEHGEALAGGQDGAGEFGEVGGRGGRAHGLPGQELGEADDRVERRQQLMADGGEEARLGGAAGFGLLLGAAQLRLGARGDR